MFNGDVEGAAVWATAEGCCSEVTGEIYVAKGVVSKVFSGEGLCSNVGDSPAYKGPWCYLKIAKRVLLHHENFLFRKLRFYAHKEQTIKIIISILFIFKINDFDY